MPLWQDSLCNNQRHASLFSLNQFKSDSELPSAWLVEHVFSDSVGAPTVRTVETYVQVMYVVCAKCVGGA